MDSDTYNLRLISPISLVTARAGRYQVYFSGAYATMDALIAADPLRVYRLDDLRLVYDRTMPAGDAGAFKSYLFKLAPIPRNHPGQTQLTNPDVYP